MDEAMTLRGSRAELAALVARGTAAARPVMPAGGADLRPAAVLVLFGALDHVPADHRMQAVPTDLDVLLVERAATLSHHPGQVSFPGGRIDPDDDGPVGAALREAVEETGIRPEGVEVLGTLAEVPVPVSRHVVTPVVAWWRTPSQVAVVDHAEAATVFRAPVADLLDPHQRRTAVVRRGQHTYRGPAFCVDGHVVWGFTAHVLDSIFDDLGWTEPWDPDRTIQVL